jgi:hypothetical protein
VQQLSQSFWKACTTRSFITLGTKEVLASPLPRKFARLSHWCSDFSTIKYMKERYQLVAWCSYRRFIQIGHLVKVKRQRYPCNRPWRPIGL